MRWHPAGAALAPLLLVLLVPAVAAHAVLLESDPAAGSRLDHAPPVVRVVLTETIDPAGSDLQVRDQDGHRVDLGDVEIRGGSRPVLTVSLPADLPDGAYAAKWTALSTVDGHFTFGTVGFAVGGFAPPDSSGGDPDAMDPAAAAARALAFVGTALVLGAAAFMRLPAVGAGLATTVRWSLLAGALLHVVGVVSILVDGARDAGLGVAAYADTDVGGILVARTLVAGAVAALAVLWTVRPVRPAPLVLAVGVLLAGAWSARLGHGSQHGVTTVALDWLHLAASALWAGALLVLVMVLRRPASHGLAGGGVARLVVRFGTVATVCVVVLAATGAIVLFAIVGDGVWGTAWLASVWGLALVAKWALFAAMLVLAWRNRRLAVRGRGADPALVRGVAVEAVLGVLVLVAAGVLTSVGAPQPASVEGTTVNLEGTQVYGSVTVQPDPVAGGSSTLRFFLRTEEGPVRDNSCGRDDCLRLLLTVPGEGAAVSFPVPEGGGFWVVEDVLWTAAGEVNATLEVQTATVYLDTLAWTLNVR